MSDYLDVQFASEEEQEDHFEQMIIDSFERWFRIPCLEFPEREGFEL